MRTWNLDINSNQIVNTLITYFKSKNDNLGSSIFETLAFIFLKIQNLI